MFDLGTVSIIHLLQSSSAAADRKHSNLRTPRKIPRTQILCNRRSAYHKQCIVLVTVSEGHNAFVWLLCLRSDVSRDHCKWALKLGSETMGNSILKQRARDTQKTILSFKIRTFYFSSKYSGLSSSNQKCIFMLCCFINGNCSIISLPLCLTTEYFIVFY